MVSRTPKSPPERQETDQSLHTEREKSDQEIHRREADIDRRSDAILEKTRDKADSLLETARGEADEALEREGTTPVQRNALQKERRDQDSVVSEERSEADAELKAERHARKRALLNLLRLERAETDERLLIERARGDEAVVARDDFMAMVSHDVRSLLGGLALIAEVQLATAPDDESGHRSRRNAQKIQRYTASIKRLVDDLVDVASIEAGRFAIEPDSDDVPSLIRDAVEAFEPAARAKDVTLTTTVPERIGVARFDHDRILQVLANLVSNAIKFTPAGGRVSLHVDPVGTEVQFRVSDTGVGMSADHLELIFERFWQVKTGDARGAGLGLYISRCIIEAHGGRIWAESEQGHGSTVSFSLPAPG